MRTIKLYGHLAKQFGKVHRFDVKNAAEAIRALRANYKDFAEYLNKHSEPGYHVVTDNGDSDNNELYYPSKGTIKIVPVITGAKSDFFKVLTGAALIGASFFLPTTPLFTGFSASLSSIAAGIGVSLALGGIAQIISPTPTLNAGQSADSPDNKPSYSFDGAVNTAAQGNAIPVAYGRIRAGSVVISSGVDTVPLPA
jgi:predicted phage tail protein